MEPATTSTAHTPGPWKVENDAPKADNGDIAIRNQHDRLIAVAYAHREAQANARLIAAAPKMLEALKLACGVIGEIPANLRAGTSAPAYQALVAVEAAIAQAEGEPGIGDPCPCCGDFIAAGHACN